MGSSASSRGREGRPEGKLFCFGRRRRALLDASASGGNFHKEHVIEKKLGKGAFASVYAVSRAQYEDEEPKYAAKVVSLRLANGRHCKNSEQMVKREVDILQRVASAGSDSVVKFLQGFKEGPFVYMVMERCDETLLDALESFEDVTEDTYRPFFKGMLRGLVVTHALGVVHRDVKPNNFMCCLGPGGHRTVKLCDFGLASVLSVEKEELYGVNGTSPFMAPEMLRGCGYGAAVDMWSFGVIVYALLFGHFPYMPRTWIGDEMRQAIRRGQPTPMFVPRVHGDADLSAIGAVSGAVSISATILAIELLERSPRTRLTAEGALKHEFLRRKFGPETSLRPMLVSAEYYGLFGSQRKRSEQRPSALDLTLVLMQLRHGHVSPWSRQIAASADS